MSSHEAACKQRMFERVAAALQELQGEHEPELLYFFIPGRIEVLGKHTDYAGGQSLLCTCERGFCVAASGRPDARVRVMDAATKSRIEFTLDAGRSPGDSTWGNYIITTARRIAQNFPSAHRGADIAFISDLPQAAGMSSSSALVVAAFLVLADVNSITETEAFQSEIRSREDLAGYLGCVENGQNFGSLAGARGVGTFGGSEDHTAMLCCRAGQLSLYSFCPVRPERTIPFPDQYVLVIGATGVVAEKTGSARDSYNRASLAVQRILEIWRAWSGRNDLSLAAVSAVAGAPDRLREVLSSSRSEEYSLLLDRFEQFLDESTAIIPSVVDALSRCDLAALGPLVDRSQLDAERLLKNQVPETIALARSARELGAAAASAFGAGFGGSVWALVHAGQAQQFMIQWSERYQRGFPVSAERASFFITRPGPPAIRF